LIRRWMPAPSTQRSPRATARLGPTKTETARLNASRACGPRRAEGFVADGATARLRTHLGPVKTPFGQPENPVDKLLETAALRPPVRVVPPERHRTPIRLAVQRHTGAALFHAQRIAQHGDRCHRDFLRLHRVETTDDAPLGGYGFAFLRQLCAAVEDHRQPVR